MDGLDELFHFRFVPLVDRHALLHLPRASGIGLESLEIVDDRRLSPAVISIRSFATAASPFAKYTMVPREPLESRIVIATLSLWVLFPLNESDWANTCVGSPFVRY